LLVEVGEFANEIKSFKAWRKKAEIDWAKAREEFIDCLGYFLGLINIYQIEIDFSLVFPQRDNLTNFREKLKVAEKKIGLEIKENSPLKKPKVAQQSAVDFNQNLAEIVAKIARFDQ
jgi:dimeric dUTPase (all-alpha-NTP-PPase superfamily)